MADSTTIFTPENGGFGNGNGWGGGIIGFILGLLFGNGNGWGGFGGGNNNNANSQRELLMTAITSQGEASQAAIQNLASSLGMDFGLVNSAIQTVASGLNGLALSQATSVPNIINAIQAGNSALQSQLSQCCCENRLLTTQQGYEAQIRTLEQTNALSGQADRNANALLSAINAQTVAMNEQFCAAKERDMQEKIESLLAANATLKSQIDNANQTNAFTAAFNVLNNKITELSAKQPQTVPVQWPQLTAVNTTPYVNGGYYGNPFGMGNGITF